jgi:hypothetical protein
MELILMVVVVTVGGGGGGRIAWGWARDKEVGRETEVKGKAEGGGISVTITCCVPPLIRERG